MLLGSTEWAETHADELQAKGVIYINSDGNGRGFLGAEGSHDFQHLVNEVAADVTDPQTGVSVARARCARGVRVQALTTRAGQRRRGGAGGGGEGRRPADRCARLGLGLFRLSRSISASRRSISALAARTRAAASITRSTTAITT